MSDTLYTFSDLSEIAQHFHNKAFDANRRAGLSTGRYKKDLQVEAKTYAIVANMLDRSLIMPEGIGIK